MAIQPYQEDSNVSNPIKRIRWATQRVTGASGQKKRHSIIDRLHHKKSNSNEKKRESGQSADTPHLGGIQEEADESTETNDHEDGRRRIFFNIPLPEDAKDEEGHPKAHFARNKIRTAKYTPLSFVPKNLWFQFHNIANVYFLFVIVLAVRNCTTSFGRLELMLLPPVLQYIRRIQSRSRLRSLDCHSICYRRKGCH